MESRGHSGSSGDQDAGEGPGEKWLSRYNVSFKQSPMYAAGAFVDTMEVATTWDNIYSLFEEVRDAVVLRTCHGSFSHAYRMAAASTLPSQLSEEPGENGASIR